MLLIFLPILSLLFCLMTFIILFLTFCFFTSYCFLLSFWYFFFLPFRSILFGCVVTSIFLSVFFLLIQFFSSFAFCFILATSFFFRSSNSCSFQLTWPFCTSRPPDTSVLWCFHSACSPYSVIVVSSSSYLACFLSSPKATYQTFIFLLPGSFVPFFSLSFSLSFFSLQSLSSTPSPPLPTSFQGFVCVSSFSLPAPVSCFIK